MTQTLDVITQSSVVSHKTVCITQTKTVLHGQCIECICDAPSRKNIWILLGLEIEDDAGKSAISISVVYKLKSAIVAFGTHFAQGMDAL